MNDYRPDTPRALLAMGAVGLMALTMGAFVVVPATRVQAVGDKLGLLWMA